MTASRQFLNLRPKANRSLVARWKRRRSRPAGAIAVPPLGYRPQQASRGPCRPCPAPALAKRNGPATRAACGPRAVVKQ